MDELSDDAPMNDTFSGDLSGTFTAPERDGDKDDEESYRAYEPGEDDDYAEYDEAPTEYDEYESYDGDEEGEAEPLPFDIEQVNAEAQQLGYESVDEYVGTLHARENTFSAASQEIEGALRQRIARGEITEAVAAELFDAQFNRFAREYDQSVQSQLSTRSAIKQRTEGFVDQIGNHFRTAAAANPLLEAHGGAAKDLVTAFTLLGGADSLSAIQRVSDIFTEVGEAAVAAYVAKQGDIWENTAPVIPSGGGTAATDSDDPSVGFRDWTYDLFRRAGIR